MRRHVRKHNLNLQPNPFVVLSDLTIALAFFFAVFSMVAALANSQAVMVVQRQTKQQAVKANVIQCFPQVRDDIRISEQGDKYVSLVSVVKLGDGSNPEVGQIWENGDLQRVKFYGQTFEGRLSTNLTYSAGRLYAKVGEVIRKYQESFGYVFIHGVVEPSEVPQTPEGKRLALDISRQRADNVYNLLVQEKVIAKDEASANANQIPAKYVITYGTGADLYTRDEHKPEYWNTGKSIGRVDIVFSYSDTREGKHATK